MMIRLMFYICLKKQNRFVEEACVLFKKMVELCVDNTYTEFLIGTSEFHKQGPGIREYLRWAKDNEVSWMSWVTVGTGDWIVDTGLAKENGLGQRPISPRASEPFSEWQEEYRRIFISALGDVGTWCDVSYDDMSRFSRGNLLRESLKLIVERNSFVTPISVEDVP